MIGFPNDRSELRRTFVTTWNRRRTHAPLEPLESLIAGVIEDHPEYHALLDDNELEREYSSGIDSHNPFLHMAMHIAIREQAAADRPPGVRRIRDRLIERTGSTVDAEHAMLDCLENALWNAQQTHAPPDEFVYLACLKRLVNGDG
ncbi:DUF1841 family protein [soil metagenome]